MDAKERIKREAQQLAEDVLREHTYRASDAFDGEPPQPLPSEGPEEMPTISMGQVLAALPSGTDQQVIDILNSGVDAIKMAKDLKALFRQHSEALGKIGLLPDYLAYAVVHTVFH